MATVWMYDSVNPSNIPPSAQIVAGYVDGRYADYSQMVADFPSALHVSITVFGQAGARVADCESGDLTPQGAAAWAKAEIHAGRRPTIYCSLSWHDAVANALTAVGLTLGRDVDWWAAGYTNSPYLAPGSVATQWTDAGPYDISDTNGVWPGEVPSPGALPLASGDTAVGIALSSAGGYWVFTAHGQVFACGVPSHGELTQEPNAPIVGGAPAANGYWMVGADGGVFNYGDAPFCGSLGGTHLNASVVGMAPVQNCSGYWLVGADGGVFSFAAPFHGSEGGTHLNKPIVGMASSSDDGYWLVAADGGVFSFGDAPFKGSAGSLTLSRPVVGMAAHPGGGYWLVASDGGIFSFGAPFFGSAGNVATNGPVVGMAATPTGHGYYLVTAGGGVLCYGDAVSHTYSAQ